jgi:hypothetical protein
MGTIVVKSRNPLRVHSRCTGRHMKGLWNVHNTTISSALSPSRLCGSLQAGVHRCPWWIAPSKHHPEIRAHQGGEPVTSNDTIAAQCLVLRNPHGWHIFASVFGPR